MRSTAIIKRYQTLIFNIKEIFKEYEISDIHLSYKRYDKVLIDFYDRKQDEEIYVHISKKEYTISRHGSEFETPTDTIDNERCKKLQELIFKN